MGTIADLLGYSLNPEEPGKDPQGSGSVLADALADMQRAERETVGNAAEETAMAVILRETQLEPSDARPDLGLKTDLDLDDILLYSVVSGIEHELKVTIPDNTVESWETLGDLLATVRSL